MNTCTTAPTFQTDLKVGDRVVNVVCGTAWLAFVHSFTDHNGLMPAIILQAADGTKWEADPSLVYPVRY